MNTVKSKFKERTLFYKIIIGAILSIFAINNILFYIQPFSSNSIFEYYTKGYFSFITSIQHIVFRIFPFSVGDIFYASILIFLIYLALKIVFSLLKKQFKQLAYNFIDFFTLIIFIWLLLGTQWNWNYLQPSIEEKMNLNNEEYDISELVVFTKTLIEETIKTKENSNFDVFKNNSSSIFDISPLGYKQLAETNDFYNYNYTSIKYSLFSNILPYLGISGYYNPFTSEAQITKGIPIVQIPFVINHEIAHQLGIASESEANFIGYLASINNPLSTIQYSGNLNLLIYCLSDLKELDYKEYDELTKNIPENIKDDINEIVEYWTSYRNKYKNYTDKAYDIFLKTNQQKDGLKSYNKVVSLAIYYSRKN